MHNEERVAFVPFLILLMRAELTFSGQNLDGCL